jgi:hypothetical protein
MKTPRRELADALRYSSMRSEDRGAKQYRVSDIIQR